MHRRQGPWALTNFSKYRKESLFDARYDLLSLPYARSLVQAGSAQLAREKSSRVLARGLAQTLAVRQTWTREQSAFCTPDWIPWTPDEVVVEVGRHRRLPAQLQTRPQQLKKQAGSCAGEGVGSSHRSPVRSLLVCQLRLSWCITSGCLGNVHQSCGREHDNASVLGGLSKKGGVYGNAEGGARKHQAGRGSGEMRA